MIAKITRVRKYLRTYEYDIYRNEHTEAKKNPIHREPKT